VSSGRAQRRADENRERVFTWGTFARAAHDALVHLPDVAYLQTHPLAHLAGLTSGSRASSRGHALQKELREAIECLRSGEEPANPGKSGRAYEILTRRYVDGQDIPTIQAQLAISKSTYYREYQRGIDALISVLQARWALSLDTDSELARSEPLPLTVVATTRGERARPYRRGWVPFALTDLIGRDREIAEVSRLLQGNRLVTLTGTGGCGKSRLAYRVAAQVAENYAEGVWVVELAALSDPALVPQAVALTLDLRVASDQSGPETMVNYLRNRQALLVLDNCEHLLDACAHLATTLLQGCSQLTVLATSRQALGIPGEVGWRVPSLATPDPERLPPASPDVISTVMAYPAVQLFVERARAFLPSFSFTQSNLSAIVQICWRLDGIPLAIELAVARVTGLTPEQIARRLDNRFHLLISGDRAALPRQQTLRATLDWSYDLLTAPERVLFRRLAVFAGGFSPEGAEDVCHRDGLEQSEVLPLLLALVDKSLVVMREQRGVARYHLLETIRQYAQELLTSAGEEETVFSRHRAWYFALVESVGTGLWDERQVVWGERLEEEHANVRLGLAWYRDNDAVSGLRLAASLWRFWNDRAHLSEGRQWLETMLSRVPDRTRLRARALLGLGYRIAFLGSHAASTVVLEESLSIFEELGDKAGLGVALGNLGWLALLRGDYRNARSHYEAALEALREAGDLHEAGDQSYVGMFNADHGEMTRWGGNYELANSLFAKALEAFQRAQDRRGVGYTLTYLGDLQRRMGDTEGAKASLEHSLRLAREIGHAGNVANALVRLASLARGEGENEKARALLEEGLALVREKRRVEAGSASLMLGKLSLAEGHYPEARERFEKSLSLLRTHGSRLEMSHCLGGFGELAVKVGSTERGIRLIGAAIALDALFLTSLDADERARCEASLTAARMAFGVEGFEKAWSKGQTMPLDEAIEYALSDVDDSTTDGEQFGSSYLVADLKERRKVPPTR
jgi:predicted ATPase